MTDWTREREKGKFFVSKKTLQLAKRSTARIDRSSSIIGCNKLWLDKRRSEGKHLHRHLLSFFLSFFLRCVRLCMVRRRRSSWLCNLLKKKKFFFIKLHGSFQRVLACRRRRILPFRNLNLLYFYGDRTGAWGGRNLAYLTQLSICCFVGIGLGVAWEQSYQLLFRRSRDRCRRCKNRPCCFNTVRWNHRRVKKRHEEERSSLRSLLLLKIYRKQCNKQQWHWQEVVEGVRPWLEQENCWWRN